MFHRVDDSIPTSWLFDVYRPFVWIAVTCKCFTPRSLFGSGHYMWLSDGVPKEIRWIHEVLTRPDGQDTGRTTRREKSAVSLSSMHTKAEIIGEKSRRRYHRTVRRLFTKDFKTIASPIDLRGIFEIFPSAHISIKHRHFTCFLFSFDFRCPCVHRC